jgi:hypothetical protein
MPEESIWKSFFRRAVLLACAVCDAVIDLCEAVVDAGIEVAHAVKDSIVETGRRATEWLQGTHESLLDRADSAMVAVGAVTQFCTSPLGAGVKTVVAIFTPHATVVCVVLGIGAAILITALLWRNEPLKKVIDLLRRWAEPIAAIWRMFGGPQGSSA